MIDNDHSAWIIDQMIFQFNCRQHIKNERLFICVYERAVRRNSPHHLNLFNGKIS